MTYTIPCPHCDQPTEPDWYGHVCNDCNVMRPHDLEASWTTVGMPCLKGFPDCVKGDCHAERCVGA